MFVLAAGDRGEQLGQGVGWGVRRRVGAAVGGQGEGFPHGVVGVGVGGGGEPAQVAQAVFAGQAQAGDQERAAGSEGAGAGPLVAEGGQGAGGGLGPVGRGPAVVAVVVVADGAADRAVQVVGPQGVRVLVDQGPVDQAPGGCLLGEAGGAGGQVEVEGVQQGDAAQQVAFFGGEVGEGAGEEGGEGAVEVGRGGGAAGAADLQEAGDREVQVQGQAVGAGGDRRADVGADEGLAVLDKAAGEVVLAVLGGEVLFTDSRCVRIGSELR
ncbi:hypothetical protein ACFV2Q_18295 [Streptomyces sp. NPDC059650]|uniref:hypothetical protein n=1 Tax=Streptomyces sp. NPDC059650 TaxID=3346896 RepID=UPI0036CF0B8B